MTSSPLKVLVVLGSMREGRMGDRVASFICRKFKDVGHEPVLLDPVTVPNEGKLLKPIHFHSDTTSIPQWMTETNELIKSCDSLVILTPEYNATLPPALLALMDNFPPASYKYKPAAIVSYSLGRFGGIRAATAARPYLGELGLVPIPKQLTIPTVSQVLDAEGQCSDKRMESTAEGLVAELVWYGGALKSYKAAVPPPLA
ncbi:NADPH-dependent FMN reductase-like [Trinorchestia longiramus]|nr:NADPH-dependent FMN reductase-like [Trinorchestia longiramus]